MTGVPSGVVYDAAPGVVPPSDRGLHAISLNCRRHWVNEPSLLTYAQIRSLQRPRAVPGGNGLSVSLNIIYNIVFIVFLFNWSGIGQFHPEPGARGPWDEFTTRFHRVIHRSCELYAEPLNHAPGRAARRLMRDAGQRH